MKLQGLAVIFIIIILPIVIVLSTYTGNLISVTNAQSSYDSILLNATYDAVRAYQMNTLQNDFEAETNSKVRDINASTNTFFNSLALGFSSSRLSKTELTDYVPAILYTLYDGYYVYGAYDNIVSISTSDGITYSKEGRVNKKQYGLKPYVYYSCEYYKEHSYDLVINYTLDNYITVTGSYLNSSTHEMTNISKSGYYVSSNNKLWGVGRSEHIPAEPANFDDKVVTLREGREEVTVKPEKLGEYLMALDEKVDPTSTSGAIKTVYKLLAEEVQYFNYIQYNGTKYYLDPASLDPDTGNPIEVLRDSNGVNRSFNRTYAGIPIFFLDKDTRIYINNNTFTELKSFLGIDDDSRMYDANDGFKDVNAYYYYYNAVNFSNSVKSALELIDLGTETNAARESIIASNIPYDSSGNLNAKNVIKTETYHINYTNELGVETHVKTTYPTSQVFKLDEYNDPDLDSSSFNMHRMDVIISSIESSLVSTISNFSSYMGGSYVYTMPVLDENDWNQICNNISVLSFIQGLTIGNYKYYNKYALVTNTKVKDFTSKDSIYVQNNGEEYIADLEYHNPRCIEYNNNLNNTPASVSVIGYSNVDYERKNCIDIENADTVNYYYLHKGGGAYECIVGQNSNQYTTDDIMEGNTIDSIPVNSELRRAYITALARERGASYKTYGFLNEEL